MPLPLQAAAWRSERGTVRKLESYIDQICRELESHEAQVVAQRAHCERLVSGNAELEGLVAELRGDKGRAVARCEQLQAELAAAERTRASLEQQAADLGRQVGCWG